MHLETLPAREHVVYTHDSVQRRQQTFGYTEEELKILRRADGPRRRRADRLDGHRHPDLAAVAPGRGCSTTTSTSSSPRSPTRRWTRSARSWSPASPTTIGPEGNLLDPGPASCRQIVLPYPVIDNDELAKILSIDEDGDLPGFKAVRVSGLYRLRDGAAGHQGPADRDLRGTSPRRSRTACASWCSPTATPTPTWRRSRRCCSPRRVHQHLVREQTRTQVALVVESGDCREVHHVAVLIGLRRRGGQPVPGVRDRSRT